MNWQTKTIEELLNYEQPQKYLVSDTNYIEKGVPVLTANKGFLLGYTDEKDGIYEASPENSVIIFDDFTCDKKFVEFNFKIKSSAIKLLTPKNGDSLQFIDWAMQNIITEIGEHKRHYLSEYQYNTIDIPNIEEQNAIVSTIQDFDEYLEKVQKKLEASRRLKKGLAQQIFSGRIRFKDYNGQDFPNWEEKKLGDIVKLRSGYMFKSSTYSESGIYNIITIANVQSGKFILDKVNKIENIPRDIQDGQILAIGDILVSMTGNVGRVCKVDVENCLLNQRVGKIICRGSVSNNFLYEVISSTRFISTMIDKAQGGSQGNLSNDDILNYEIYLPSLPEQKKIAEFLCNIGEIINSLEKLLESAKTQKKWLLDNLVTGKIRLREFRNE